MHIHTNRSDGKLSLKEILSMCDESNVDIISITDHDCIDAYNTEQLDQYKVKIIRGIEFAAEWDVPVHVLGYNIELTNNEINGICDKIKQYRMQEFLILIKKLKSIGIKVPVSELRKRKKMNIDSLAQYLYEQGYGENVSDIKKKYLGKHSELYVKKKAVNISEVIKAIHSAGGKAVLAHPWRYSQNIDEMEKIIISLKEIGLEGVEVLSNKIDKNISTKLIKICRDNCLICTGGSDFHGKEGEKIGIESDEIEKFINNIF